MTLYVLIVNYNVCYFLEHCLLSVDKASACLEHGGSGWNIKVLVIDNDSSDRSMQYLPAKFPKVEFIRAGANLGFSRANNFALAHVVEDWSAAGNSQDVVLFLNPDTILVEETLQKTISYLVNNPDVGACGVRMIDGGGRYLPESKRGFPGSWNSLCKMSGLATLFPRSSFFAGYYEGNLDERKTQPVAILSGAFMMVKAAVLHKVGSFDERFFMYAEDIDLSYRIMKAGYKNLYVADTTILHFKGESTKKDSEYVSRFYNAMILFVDKHFNGLQASGYKRLLRLLIRLKSRNRKSLETRMSGVQDTNTSVSSIPLTRVFIAGDEQAMLTLKKQDDRIGSPGSTTSHSKICQSLTDEKLSAAEVIYCIGQDYGYSEVIRDMQNDHHARKLVYHPDAGALVGSDLKEEQGAVQIL